MRTIFFTLALILSGCFLLLLPIIVFNSHSEDIQTVIFNPFNIPLGVAFALGFGVFTLTLSLLYDMVEEERKQTVYGLIGKILSVGAILLFLLYIVGMSSQILFTQYGDIAIAGLIGKGVLWGAFFFVTIISLLLILEFVTFARKKWLHDQSMFY